MSTQLSTEKAALIYDDHELFAASFSILLQKSGHFSVVHTFKSEAELTQFILQNPLNNPYLFCDYFVPGSNTIHLIFNVHKFCPSAKIIMVSSISNGWLIRKILSYKVNGFISKSDGIDQITACLSAVANKEVFVSASIESLLSTSSAQDVFAKFTPRELEVLIHSSWGKTVEEIAEILNLSKSTVITHRRNMLAKSGTHSFTHLVAQGIRSGIIPES
jgi:DNA-binding NarL/FixJ family response regulator